jgi:hypothetical protein
MSIPIDMAPDDLVTTSIDDSIVNIEKENALEEFVRPLTTGRWILVCVGLYHGAILYG